MLSQIERKSASLDAACYVSDLARSLHPIDSGLRILGMFEGFFDESGIHRESRVFVLAGFLAPEADWLKFIPQWNAALSEEGINVFHAKDCNAREGEFAKFKDDLPRRNAFVEKLLSPLLSLRNIVPFYSGVVIEDFNILLKKHLTPPNQNPYYFCMMNIMADMGIVLDMNSVPKSETIACVFDRQKQFSERALSLFDEIVEGKDRIDDPIDRAIRERFDSIAFASKRRFKPLQVADALAFDVYHEFKRRCFDPDKEPRPSFAALTVNERDDVVKFTGQLWDRPFIETMLANRQLGTRQEE